MYSDDKEKVMLAYREKQENGTLSVNLVRPSPGKLKKECLIVCQEKSPDKDDAVLRAFFGPKNKEGNYFETINKCDIDKFRPLVYFLRGEINNPDDKNIKLLAWLINFEENNGKEKGIPPEVIEPPKPVPPLPPKPPQKPWYKRIEAIILLTILLMSAGLYLLLIIINPKHMYWADDHYEPISWADNTNGKTTIAFDQQKADYFKKITRPDTLKEKDLAKIWVAGRGFNIECFTADGNHPITQEPLRTLKPYELYKYILKRSPD